MASWGPYFLAAFLASLVEFVEAMTIILAVGATRGWRPALLGAGAGPFCSWCWFCCSDRRC